MQHSVQGLKSYLDERNRVLRVDYIRAQSAEGNVFLFFLANIEHIVKRALILIIIIYQTVFSRFMGGNCRFHPSCSNFALEALHRHSLLPALSFIFKRITSCYPFGRSGYDPMPPTRS